MRKPNYEIVEDETTKACLVIRDLGPHHVFPSVTNGAEQVIEELSKANLLPFGRRLEYYDSEGNKDQLLHDGTGCFIGFAPAGVNLVRDRASRPARQPH